jgi:SAM-dependent methyltransferase
MSTLGRGRLDRALRRARTAAYEPGEFAGQESFMRASEILSLVAKAGVGPGVSVLDLCCGVAGPGRLVTRELGCAYLGVDASPSAVDIARERAGGLGCRFRVASVPPVPHGRFDVVLLLETMLAFEDKAALLREVSSALAPSGRFVFTLEEGRPLSAAERVAMPNADTVWLTPLSEMLSLLDRAGFRVVWEADCSHAHRVVVDSLVEAMATDAGYLDRQIGRHALDALLTAHLLWSDWLRRGRARKFAFVVERADPGLQ